MSGKAERFDALAFKDEMQRKAEERLAGLSPQERRRRIREDIESGPLAEWWKGLPRARESRRLGQSTT